MYFQDLSPYKYLRERRNMLNVGWLSQDHSFPIGDTTQEFRRVLNQLASEPVNLCCGHHDCEFCELPPRKSGLRGNGEIHVPATHGDVVYAAPQLVAHYVEVHRYLPPAAFLEAVLAYEVLNIGWKEKQEREKEERRSGWKDRFPALDGKWTQWRLYDGDGDLLIVASEDELSLALDMAEQFFAMERRTEVSRSYRDPSGDGVVIESLRHAISHV